MLKELHFQGWQRFEMAYHDEKTLKVLIDLEYETFMEERELKSLAA